MCKTVWLQLGKNPPAMQETWLQSLDWEDLLEKGKATHSSILAWRIPWASLIAQLVKNPPASAGDPSSIPELWRSAGEGIGYWLQYSWASLVVQLVKNPPAMQETWLPSLGWDDPLEKGKATHSSILAWRIPWTVYSMGSQRVGQDWMTFTSPGKPMGSHTVW